MELFRLQPMDIEPPIKPATDSDDNKSNDSTASQPQHLQEMAKSTVVIKEVAAPVAPNDNASSDMPPSVVLPAEAAPLSSQNEIPKTTEVVQPPLSAPPVVTTIPATVTAPGPIPHSQEAPIAPPNVTVTQHHPSAIPGHMPPHGTYAGFPQGPPRAPFYGHMPPYQQGFQQYPPYGHHMPPYQQNFHGPPPHGYPVPGAENHYPPIPHQPLPAAAVVQPPPEEAPEKSES